MANKKATDLRKLSDDQLAAQAVDSTKKLFLLRMKAATEKVDAPSEFQRLRREVARIKTIQTQRAAQAGTNVGGTAGAAK